MQLLHTLPVFLRQSLHTHTLDPLKSFADTRGVFWEARSTESRRKGLGICTAQSGHYLALATLSTLEISKAISAISTSLAKGPQQLQTE